MVQQGPKLFFGTGRLIDAYNFTREQLDPTMLGTSLSRIARFSGNGNRSVSVAQHSVNLSHLVGADLDDQRAALMHDVPEIFTGDVPSPIKRLCRDIQLIDDRIIAHISEVYQIPLHAFARIHDADGRIANDEKLFMFDELSNEDYAKARQNRFGLVIHEQHDYEAANNWVARFRDLFEMETH